LCHATGPAASSRYGSSRDRPVDGFDDKILSLCARGMAVREIQGHLSELYGAEVSPKLISRVTDAVLDESGNGKPVHPTSGGVFRRAAGKDSR
jgi:hypothetical protein